MVAEQIQDAVILRDHKIKGTEDRKMRIQLVAFT